MIYQNSFQNWIFDLDNTMYDINLGLFKKISNRITDFIMSKYSLDIDQAKKIQKEYYLKYGLTLRGLIVEKKLEPEEFLDYVHDVEHPELKKNDQLISKIRILEGKKILKVRQGLPTIPYLLKLYFLHWLPFYNYNSLTAFLNCIPRSS